MTIREASRDALQGIKHFIPTDQKISYLSTLLKVGFGAIDCVSFVSPKVIPQLKDSAEVLRGIASTVGQNQLMAIVAHPKGAEEACTYPMIKSLGYPLSVSETFQQKNTRRSISEAFRDVELIYQHTQNSGKELVIFLSMGFGNPYGDKYDESILLKIMDQAMSLGISDFSLADTIGIATPRQAEALLSKLLSQFPESAIGAHFHTVPTKARDLIAAAYQAGCSNFDGTLHGYGGCPMAKDTLTGNLSTQAIISYLEAQGENLQLDTEALNAASIAAEELFSSYT